MTHPRIYNSDGSWVQKSRMIFILQFRETECRIFICIYSVKTNPSCYCTSWHYLVGESKVISKVLYISGLTIISRLGARIDFSYFLSVDV